MNIRAKFGVSSSKNSKKGQTDRHGYIDLAVDADQEYIHFMGSATPPSACYTHLHKGNRPFCNFFKVQGLIKLAVKLIIYLLLSTFL